MIKVLRILFIIFVVLLFSLAFLNPAKPETNILRAVLQENQKSELIINISNQFSSKINVLIEADEERNIPADYLIVKGVVFNFRNAMLPVEFIVKNAGGIKYFESLEAAPSNLVFTKVWGKINCETVIDKKEEESAFGESAVKEYERKIEAEQC